jgi:uncharacterized protein (DUF1330 family)
VWRGTGIQGRARTKEVSSAAIDPTPAQARRLASGADSEPIVMVNLLRFRDRAAGDDAGFSGVEAHGRYAAEVAPLLERVGGRLLAAAACEESVIGPDESEWDLVALVEYPSRAAFLAMATSPEYGEIGAHRANALADSRLILARLAPTLG